MTGLESGLTRAKVDLAWFAHAKPELLWTLVAASVLVLLHALLIVRLNRRLHAVAHVTHRLERLTAALSLLTDTMESGLTNLAGEVQHLSRKAAPRQTSRAATRRRIAGAAKRGEPVDVIATREALSESEVHLHLALNTTPADPGASDDHLLA